MKNGRGVHLLAQWIALAAPLPFVAAFLFALWSKDWYRFYPLLLAVALYLVRRRYVRHVKQAAPRPSRPAGAALALSVPLLFVAVACASPWLAAVVFLVALAAVGSRLAGTAFRRHFLPVWAILWLMVPPPFGLDEHLIALFHRLVSRGAEFVLDYLGHLHWLTGNVLQTVDQSFLLDDDYLRFVSPYAVMAGAAALAVWRRRSLAPALLAVVLAPCWLAVAEIAGIACVPAAFRAWRVDLAARPQALFLVGGVVALTLVLVYSADQLLRPLPAATAAAGRGVAALYERVSRFLPRKKKKRRRHTHASAFRTAHVAGGEPPPPPDARAPRGAFANWSSVLVCGALIGLQLAVLAGYVPRPARSVVVDARLRRLEVAPPAKLGDWRLQRASAVRLDVMLPTDPRTRQWRYASAGSDALAAVCPISLGDRGLLSHLARRGWRVYRRSEPPALGLRRNSGLPQVETELVKPSGEAASLFSAIVDDRGVSQRPVVAALLARWRATPLCGLLARGKLLPLPLSRESFRLHLLVVSEERLSRAERNAARGAFQAWTQFAQARWKQP